MVQNGTLDGYVIVKLMKRRKIEHHTCNVHSGANIGINRKRRIKISLPSKLLLMLVRGKRESLSSRTTSVRDSSAGSCFVKRFMCPGNHDGGEGSAGNGITGGILD